MTLAPLARDPDAPRPDAVFAEFELKEKTPCYMARTQGHKYIYNDRDIAELYDLENDRGELQNRAEDAAIQPLRRRM